jgi:antitoxin ParD1/3/4
LTQTETRGILADMRATMNISLPATLKEWVDQQIDRGGFGTASEYIRHLLREERQRQARREVEAKLAEAEASGAPVPVTATTWKQSEERVKERLKASRKGRADGSHR